MWFNDVFLIIFGQQWSTVALRNKIYQALATQTVRGGNQCWFCSSYFILLVLVHDYVLMNCQMGQKQFSTFVDNKVIFYSILQYCIIFVIFKIVTSELLSKIQMSFSDISHVNFINWSTPI